MPTLKRRQNKKKTPHFIFRGRNLIKSLSGFVEALMLSCGPSVYVFGRVGEKHFLS